jgi:formylglycine-generating enzyme
LERKIYVVPVAIDGALLPSRKDLPKELKGLLNHQGLELHCKFFDDQAGRLVKSVVELLNPQGAAESTAAAAKPASAAAPAPKPPLSSATTTTASRSEAPAWASKTGIDTRGLWAEFTVGDQVQRLRWIEPGSFWMGSPDTEKGRGSDEQRHRVTLTQGFWMADTACTQGLWQAVMGDNPSKFTGEGRRPVEQVSWDDVTQRFLPELNRQVAGLQAVLPTEAQWEYACRAGSETPFCIGEQITPQRVNYDGNHPYAGGAKGEYREKTVVVKSLPPNDWVLYEVHGNVFEWCADVYGPYPSSDVTDPTGIPSAGSRVLRGGSWNDSARWCRAAHRDRYQRDYRNGSIGFRLCVSSPI